MRPWVPSPLPQKKETTPKMEYRKSTIAQSFYNEGTLFLGHREHVFVET
jgi:hypothetical protein